MRSGSDVGNKLSEMRTRIRERRLSDRVEDAGRESERLRAEVRLLRQELDQERGSRERLLSLLERLAGGRSVEVKRVPRKRGGMLRAIVVGGIAYLLGAKAGRERYQQIVARWRNLVRPRSEEDRWHDVPGATRTAPPASTSPSGAPATGVTAGRAGSDRSPA
ncbi:MAG TPA: hypothetical protein VNO79_00925 [Actinomycetota bacterium]|nr:hypothetical protein [Actinomycetota bacterium]